MTTLSRTLALLSLSGGLAVGQNSTIIPPISTVNNYTVIATNTPSFFVATNGVASGPGTLAQPWTLAYAIAHAGQSNTIIVLPGTNYPTVLLNNPALHTGLKFVSQVKWGAKIYGQPSVHIWEISSTVSNITVDGFELAYSYIDGLKQNLCVGNTVRNCWIHNAGQGDPAWVTNGTGVYQGQGVESILTRNCVIENNLIENNGAFVNNDHGIYASGTNNVIRNNVVRENLVFGIQVYSGAANTGSADNRIYNNAVYGNDTQFGIGIRCVTVHCSDAEEPPFNAFTNYVYNNFLVDTKAGFPLVADAGIVGCTNNILLNGSGSACLIGQNGGTVAADYCISTNTLAGAGVVAGPHNILADPGLVNPATGLFWLTPGSPARGAALGGLYGQVDFFGNLLRTNSDIGPVQFNTSLAGDIRAMDPSPATGADYWTLPTAFNAISPTIASASGWQTYTNRWGGATNTVDLAGPGDLVFMSPTACSFTGVLNKGSTSAQTVTVKLSNTSATNWNLTMAATFLTRDGARSYTVGPGQDLITTVCYDPGNGHTNTTNILNF